MGMDEIKWDGLFTDGTSDYRFPEEADPGDTVRIRFRTSKDDLDGVYIYLHETGQKFEMELEKQDTYFDYYTYSVTVGQETLRYAFLLEKGETVLYYNRLGVSDNRDPELAFHIIPGFHVPGWARGAVMYQIFIDRFCDGDPSNNVLDNEYIYLGHPVKGIKNWETPVEAFDVHRFYGGDLQGVMNKLDYLQSLKVEVIYFNPLFVSPSNHKYDTQDYEHIDPHIGRIVKDGGMLADGSTMDDSNAYCYSVRSTSPENLEASDALFLELVQACHARGMRVIIDGVFNHCGSFNKWLNKSNFYHSDDPSGMYKPGAYQRKDSPYHGFFAFADNNDQAWPNNNSYEQWWGNDTLPKLNYEGSEELVEKILSVGRKWVSEPYCVDGWRLDVAADLGHSEAYNHSFWKRFRKAVKDINPEVLILAEHYGDPYRWLCGNEWDTIMNYDAFMEPVSWFLTGIEKHSDRSEDNLRGDGKAFFDAMIYHMARMPENAILCSMNQLSNHDHSRFMTRTNLRTGRIASVGSRAADEGVNPALYRLAAMIQMTWPGAPTLYYGDEVGMTGWTEPDSRRPFIWGHEDLELIEFHKYLTGVRKRNPVFRTGSLIRLMAGHNHVVYGRMLGDKVGLVVINCGPDQLDLQIPVWRLGITDKHIIRRRLMTYAAGYNAGQNERQSEDGMIICSLGGFTGKIYTAEIESEI